MFKAFAKVVIVSVLFYYPVKAFAWGAIGHRIVGQIASSYLTTKAQREIRKILGTETIALASTWADFIKSDTNYNYLSPWHYVNFKAGLSRSDIQELLKTDTGVNAHTKLNFLISELKNNHQLSSEKKQMYLRLVIHLVGDVHQPMHTGRPEDLGGNRVRLMWFNTPTNLHRVWDEQLIEHQQLSYTEYSAAINFTTKQQRQQWQSEPMTEWFYESYQISNRLYDQIRKPDENLGWYYNFINIETVNQQLLKAGVRLAGVLNEIYG